MAEPAPFCTPAIAQTDTSIPCNVVKNPDGTYQAVPSPFDRIFVDYFVLGCTRVSWDMTSNFRALEPWIFQLQEAESDVPAANWHDVGSPVMNVFLAIDPSQEYCGKEATAFYRVQLTTGDGKVYTSFPVQASGVLSFKNWHFAAEIARKEQLRLRRLGVGIEGFLLKSKRSGVPCPACLDKYTGEVTDSNCTICYGQRWVGGFYAAVPSYYGDFPPSARYANRVLEQGEGMVNVRIAAGIFVAQPFIAMNDVFVNKTSDERHQIHQVETLTHIQGVPVISKAELRLIPTDWIIYQFPVPK